MCSAHNGGPPPTSTSRVGHSVNQVPKGINAEDLHLLEAVSPDMLNFRPRGGSRKIRFIAGAAPNPLIMAGYNTMPIHDLRFKPGVSLKLPRGFS